MKRIIACLLVALMLGACCIGCKNEEPQAEEPKESSDSNLGVDSSVVENSDSTVPLVALPKEDYNGYTFKFFMQSGEYMSDIKARDLSSAQTDVVEKAVYARNKKIEAAYNVTIETIEIPNGNSGSLAIDMIKSGAFEYDVVTPHGRYASSFLVNGVLYDWNRLPNLNTTYEWWNQSAREAFTVNGKLFYMTGDLAHTATAASYCVFANKTRLEKNGYEVPYSDVKNGTWTWEKFKTMALDCAEDDGDGIYTLGTDDVFGYNTAQWSGTFAAYFASGCRSLSYDANGAPYNSMANELAYNALDEFFRFCKNPQCHLNGGEDGNGNMSAGDFACVSSGNFVFADYTPSYIQSHFMNVGYEYAFLPYPKMNDLVTGYSSHTAGSVNMFCIPNIAQDPTRTAVILEALCQEGHKTVIPTYFDNVISLQTMNTRENYEMLQIIKSAQIYDPGYFLMGYVGSMPAYLATKGSADEFYSYIQTQESKSASVIENLLAAASN